MDLAHKVHSTGLTRDSIVFKSRLTLQSLFPNFPPPPPSAPPSSVGLLYWFRVLFAGPFPAFTLQLLAHTTHLLSQWLMGSSSLSSLPTESTPSPPHEASSLSPLPTESTPSPPHEAGAVLMIKRCRYLEAASCASVCVNTCKLPTQEFFAEDMGVPVKIVPDYETLSCRFEFGVRATEEDEVEAGNVKCFDACRSKGGERERLKKCM